MVLRAKETQWEILNSGWYGLFPKGHSGYREQDGSRGEGAKRESSEEPLDCGSEGRSVLRDAPSPPAPRTGWLAGVNSWNEAVR